jgi:hypothetical protein
MRASTRRLPASSLIVAAIMMLITVAVATWTSVRSSTAAPVAPAPPGVLLDPLATGAGCLIQSSFGTESGNAGNFEVVVQQGTDLVHYWHPNAEAGLAWQRAQVISTTATAPGCLIQSTRRAGGPHGNLEAIVPEAGGTVTHYASDSSRPGSPWQAIGSFGTNVTGSVSMTQSRPRAGAAHGDFEVVVTEGTTLVHYSRDNRVANGAWRRVGAVATGVTGGGAIIQSDFPSADTGRFEVVANEGGEATHFWRERADGSAWNRARSFATNVIGAPSLIQSRIMNGTHGRFDVSVRQGNALKHWVHDNSDVNNTWLAGQTIASDVASAGSLIHSRLGQGPGNFEAVVLSGRPGVPPGSRVRGGMTDFHLVHRFFVNGQMGQTWRAGQTVTYRGRSEKVCQLTGARDRQHGLPASNNTAAESDFGFTDIGYPVEVGSTLKLYFGDSRDAQNNDRQVEGIAPEIPGDDGVGIIDNPTPPTFHECLRMRIAEGPDGRWAPLKVTPKAAGTPFRQGLFNVPASGFTVGSKEYTIFFTDHCWLTDGVGNCLSSSEGTNAFGRSVITRNTGETAFQELHNLPAPLNAATAALNSESVPGAPVDDKAGVFVWAVKQYRFGYPQLAWVPSGSVETPSAWRYFGGFDTAGKARWLTEAALTTPPPTGAQPVFATGDPEGGCIGEMHVSWVAPLQRYVMLYNCVIDRQKNLAVVRARTAERPWGPWSAPSEILHPATDAGWCRYLHQQRTPACDQLGADNRTLFLTPAEGAPYGPYVLSRFTRPKDGGAELTFLLSTWNPYQVVVMRTTLTASP